MCHLLLEVFLFDFLLCLLLVLTICYTLIDFCSHLLQHIKAGCCKEVLSRLCMEGYVVLVVNTHVVAGMLLHLCFEAWLIRNGMTLSDGPCTLYSIIHSTTSFW